ncbi:uncharacterized protein LOC126909367 isoform X2 [Daktulosphaira vitifoliae]|uniref:uncharacterized protein LOC126909367 isoform X2 n=1 Tax=Daktulosphaira vitifoliae TaxID=58002 RepID=UPI0021A9A073|nr:uncharacterized protein LOC126909367 isoform X2 [Daktulosphaira vitifoliae]
MISKKGVFRRVIKFVRKLCARQTEKNVVANFNTPDDNIDASGDSALLKKKNLVVQSNSNTDERRDVPVKRDNGIETMADKITDIKESIKREILDDPKLEIIIRNHIDDLMSEIVQEIVQKYLLESSDYLIKNIDGQEKRKTDEIKINKTLTELKDMQQNNDLIPSAPPLPQTLPTLQKAENNIKNKGKVYRPAGLPKNLIDEIKRGVKLKPVSPMVKVLEKSIIDDKNLRRLNPFDNIIPSPPPHTLLMPLKSENNVKSKGKVYRPAALPKNLIEEIKRGVKLKPVKPVVSVIENPKINENDFERMNPLGIPMFRRASMMSSSSSSDTSSEYFSLDEWDN